MEVKETKKQFITLTVEHKRSFEQLCRNLVNGKIKRFNNENGYSNIFIEPNHNIGYTNKVNVIKISFTDNMEIEYLLFGKDNGKFNKLFNEIIPISFFRDNHIGGVSYRIEFYIKEQDLNLTVVFNKNCNMSEINSVYIKGKTTPTGERLTMDVVIEGFELEEIIKNETVEKPGLFNRIFGL